ncbi:type II secretion system protein N [Variovorax sp. OV329]|uniref:type II secretion system protein N n=1 Tax=Variovorax sp. OV329 TaxID=1882825 RepID=UPI0008F40856|nr:type II secretion system protein N [Variovorax sp. OV329]SFM16850.1 general secretion pathway protein N [Variovorax sp. OV329]
MVTRSSHFRPGAAVPRGRGWRWALLGGLLGAAITFTLYAPARWLASVLRDQSAGRLLLVNPRGTVWNGNAGVVFASGAGGADAISLPGSLNWKLRPSWSGIRAALDLSCCTKQPLGVQARPGVQGLQVRVEDGQSRWPAALLAGFGAPFNTLKPDGVLDLSTQGLELRVDRQQQLAFQGRATLDATDISSSLSTLKPMGSYRVVLEGGSAPSLLLTTREGALRLSGSGRWTGTRLRFSGEASAAPGREDALSNLLNIIGRRDGARSIINLG